MAADIRDDSFRGEQVSGGICPVRSDGALRRLLLLLLLL